MRLTGGFSSKELACSHVSSSIEGGVGNSENMVSAAKGRRGQKGGGLIKRGAPAETD